MKLLKICNPINGADLIFNIVAEKCDFYKDQNGELYMVYSYGHRYRLVYLSNASEAKQLFYRLFFDKNKKTVKSGDVANAYNMVCALVEDTATEMPVFLRIAQFNNTILYNLNNPAEQVVEITTNGVSIKPKNTVGSCFFKSDTSLQEQRLPMASEYKLIDFINDFINVSESQKILLAVYLCAMFIPCISHPILVVEGEKGAGKSVLFKLLSCLVNPVKKDVLALPDNADDLVTTLANNYFCVFDNLSAWIKPEISNILCQASTGGTLTKRKLYSDNTEIAISIQRLVALNGINLEIKQSDLLDRTILVNLSRIEEENRRTEEEIREKFATCVPSVLADIFSIISKAIGSYKKVKLAKLPRMADFTKYGYAIAEAMEPGMGDKFLKAYDENIAIALESAVGENPLIECVILLLEKEGEWQGKAIDLLAKLKAYLPDVYVGKNLPASFPRMPNNLSRQLMTLKAEFKSLGILVEKGRGKDRYLCIKRLKNAKISSLPTTPSTETNKMVTIKKVC